MTDLRSRLEALEQLIALESTVQPEGMIDPAAAERQRILDRSESRLGHGTGFVIAALAGPTGAGKSTLFNALAGADIAQSGVRRPTTFATQALVWGDDATEVCDWLGVAQRHHLQGASSEFSGHENLRGLIILDLPDFDSIADGNRAEVDRLVALVDLFVWVADPQKYADESLHVGYLQRLSGHSDVMRFVLSKSDTLSPEALSACVADFSRLLRDDGVANPVVLPVSAASGDGVAELHGELAAVAAAQSATAARIEADLVASVADLTETVDAVVPVTRRSRKDLTAALAAASGAEHVKDLVAAQHTQDGRAQLGWPPLRWVQKFRKRPITELPTLQRSTTMAPQVDNALRAYADGATQGLEPRWARSIVRSVRDVAPQTAERLDSGVSNSWRASAERPRWWKAGTALQWLLFATAVVGLAWLLLLFVIESFLRVSIVDYTPTVWNAPLPTWLLLGGLVAGMLMTLVLRIPLSIGATRRGAKAAKALEAHADQVAEELVVPAVDRPLQAATDVRRLAQVIARR